MVSVLGGGVLLLLLSCTKVPETHLERIAVLSIPAKPVQQSLAVLDEAVREIERLGPDRTVVLMDPKTYAQEHRRAVLERVLTLPRRVPLEFLFVPGAGKLRFWELEQKPVQDKKAHFRLVELENLRLLFLDSSDSLAEDRISRRELRWLHSLRNGGGTPRPAVAFIDRPVWNSALFPGPNNWWQEVHPALVALNVRAVVAGFVSGYLLETERDSVAYVRSAGIGDTLDASFDQLGNFPHFLWIRVQGQEVEISPVRIGSVLPDTAVTGAQVRRARAAAWEMLSQPEFPVPERPRKFMRRTIEVFVKNPQREPISGRLSWKKPNEDWRIYPPEVNYRVPPGGQQRFSFNVWLVRLSSLNRNLPLLEGRFPPAEGMPPRRLYRLLAPKRNYSIGFRKFQVSVNGDLNEWLEVTPLLLNNEYLTSGIPGWSARDLSVALYSVWDTTGLYLGVDVKDNRLLNTYRGADIRKGDCVEIGLDALGDRRSPGFDEDDHDLGFAFTKHGPIAWRWSGPPQMRRGRTFGVPFAVQRIPGHTIYEILLPAREVAPLRLEKNAVFGMTIAVHDDDGSGWKGAMLWTGGLLGKPYPALFARVRLRK